MTDIAPLWENDIWNEAEPVEVSMAIVTPLNSTPYLWFEIEAVLSSQPFLAEELQPLPVQSSRAGQKISSKSSASRFF